MNAYDTIIVGSGINSLVCAALLARKGHRVLLLERNDRLGGCIRTEEITQPGFVHDVLSAWHPLFVSSAAYAELRPELEQHGLEYGNADLATGVVLPDGRSMVLGRSRAGNIQAMNAIRPGDGDRYAAAMQEFESTFALTATLLGGDLWTWTTLRTLLAAIWKLGLRGTQAYAGYSLETARAWLESTFESDLIRACFAPWTLHGGMGPDTAGSAQMARIIPFTLEAFGSPVVKGGAFRLVQAFEQIIRKHGGECLLNADVTKVNVKGGVAQGVTTRDGKTYEASRAVICNVTPGQLYTQLLEKGEVPDTILNRARNFRHGRADMQIHLALRQPPKWNEPGLGKVPLVHLSGGIDAVSRAVNAAERGLLPAEPTIVLGQPLVADPGRAPHGAGILWIQILELPSHINGDECGLIGIPKDGSWIEPVREAFADRVVARIARHVPGLEGTILRRRVYSPADLAAMNINLVGGDPYGGACTPDQLLFWRPLRGLRGHQTPIRKLFHIGASTHPGAGLSGGSGYHVAQRL